MKFTSAIVILLIALVFSGFNKGPKEFSRYCSTLKTIKMPYILRCGLDEKDYEGSNQDKGLEGQLKLPEHIVGKLYPNSSYVVLLNGNPGDDIYPELHTYTLDGVGIDTLLLGGSCQGWPESVATSTVIFSEERVITKYDSLWSWSRDSNDHIIFGSDTLSVEITNYTIDSSGKFTSTKLPRSVVARRR